MPFPKKANVAGLFYGGCYKRRKHAGSGHLRPVRCFKTTSLPVKQNRATFVLFFSKIFRTPTPSLIPQKKQQPCHIPSPGS
ncbi:MAG: hypothetical protein D6714_13830 [Bacteroidetes bacterium]|nr:MAG: hypothetical protein D6714_13830 [Bacteroidota bacterium]